MRIQIVLFFIVALLFTACEYTDGTIQYDLGTDFIDDPTRMFLIDTFTMNTYTSVVDTLSTSRTKRFLAGQTKNNLGISTYCETYFRLDPEKNVSFHESASFDSVSFILRLDGYKFGDTTKVSEFEIFRLKQDIVINDTTYFIYNNTRFEVEDEPIGRFSVDFKKETDSIHVRLNDDIGKKIYDMYVNKSDTVTDKDLFKEYFKGISIRPVNGNAHSIVGFSAIPDTISAPRIRIYYSDNTLKDDHYFDLSLEIFDEIYATKINYFAHNYMSYTLDNPKLAALKTTSELLSSSEIDNLNYLLPGVLMNTKIEIPNIDDTYNLGTSTIIKAELLIYPLEESFSKESDLPNTISMKLIDSKGRIFSPLYKVGSTSVESSAVLRYNKEFKHLTHYSFDITSYVKDEYDSKAFPEYSLFMYLPRNNVYPTVNPLIFGDQKKKHNKLMLKVYMANF